jgi:hypothetical protein
MSKLKRIQLILALKKRYPELLLTAISGAARMMGAIDASLVGKSGANDTFS